MDAFLYFLSQRESDLKRIARATRGEHQYDDVVSESWLIAQEIASRLDRQVDFREQQFQDLVLSHLYQELVRYTELNVRHAVRLDHTSDDDSGEGKPHWLMKRFVSDDGHDPLAFLLVSEAIAQRPADGEDHPSQAGAWLKLLRDHRNHMPAVARRLLISVSHAYRCCAKAHRLAVIQNPIPFDSEELLHRLGPWRRHRIIRVPRQLEFNFEDQLPV